MGQSNVLPETQRRLRGHNFYPPKAQRAAVPALGASAGEALEEKVVHLHYFLGSADWFIVEVDWTTGEGWGFADLGLGHGEWGYIALTELEELRTTRGLPQVVERELDWEPVPFGQTRAARAAR
ncbi:DUF2958 domain-containing protein [Cellulosimicrobium funkei]|nr:DUF2958 domain-containing protein [Cellulosimicrobium funkei]